MSEKILVVEDNLNISNILKYRLTKEGYDIVTLSDGLQVMEIVRRQIPDLVLLDIMLPGISGIDLLPEIKKEYPDTAVIMTTAVSDADTAMKCIRRGAYDYFTKPFNLYDVLIGVKRALINRRLELEVRDYQLNLEEKVKIQSNKIRNSFINAITALALALDAKDEYTSGHSLRVSAISVILAKELGLTEDAVEKIKLAGLIHDIGKIGVKGDILNKPGTLTPDEFEHVKSHSEVGEHILEPIIEDKEILQMVRMHHERYDGSGYPDRLAGNLIPVEVTIMALADAYDAMTSDRPYRKALEINKAIEEIENGAGIQFAPSVVEALLKIKPRLSLRITNME